MRWFIIIISYTSQKALNWWNLFTNVLSLTSSPAGWGATDWGEPLPPVSAGAAAEPPHPPGRHVPAPPPRHPGDAPRLSHWKGGQPARCRGPARGHINPRHQGVPHRASRAHSHEGQSAPGQEMTRGSDIWGLGKKLTPWYRLTWLCHSLSAKEKFKWDPWDVPNFKRVGLLQWIYYRHTGSH